jgi:NADPH:quinone reductase-like Zn-dependent oxidoreductase
MKHKHIVITRIGGPELQMVEDKVSKPKPGGVRVKILATGLQT